MIIPIKAFKDNYIWMLIDSSSKKAWVVDPGDANPVQSVLESKSLELSGILLTHHHYDHSGGIADLLKQHKNIEVFSSHISRVSYVTRKVKDGDIINCGPFAFKILEIPGHTLDHIAFYNDELLFCGDTLFSAGCGRVFEGTYPQMYATLQKILALPQGIKIYCGHEYTLTNLYFAEKVEPTNLDVLEKIKVVKKLRDEDKPTLPSTLFAEKKINPFLRTGEKDVVQAVANEFSLKDVINPAEVFKLLREWKNSVS